MAESAVEKNESPNKLGTRNLKVADVSAKLSNLEAHSENLPSVNVRDFAERHT